MITLSIGRGEKKAWSSADTYPEHVGKILQPVNVPNGSSTSISASSKVAFVLGNDGVGRIMSFEKVDDLFPDNYTETSALWSTEAVLHHLPSGASLGQSLKLVAKDAKSWMMLTANGQLVRAGSNPSSGIMLYWSDMPC